MLSHLAGIRIFGTGGLGKLIIGCLHIMSSLLTIPGGVHRGGEVSMDVSGEQPSLACQRISY